MKCNCNSVAEERYFPGQTKKKLQKSKPLFVRGKLSKFDLKTQFHSFTGKAEDVCGVEFDAI